MKELIRQLVEAFGPSGNEGQIRELIRSKIEGKVDEIRIDNMGNLIALKKGKDSNKQVMLAAHPAATLAASDEKTKVSDVPLETMVPGEPVSLL